jgi:acetyl-CoA synthetase
MENLKDLNVLEIIQNRPISKEDYSKLYDYSIKYTDIFWDKIASRITWIQKYRQVKDISFNQDDFRISWYKDGILNASVNCIDRHLKENKNKTAIIFEPDNPNKKSQHITYQTLHDEVCKFSNLLKSKKVKKGDRVIIYMPMIKESIYAILACSRIGAIHCVVFAGFSSNSLAHRIKDCESKTVITCDEGFRGGKNIPLKINVDKAIRNNKLDVQNVIVVKNSHTNIKMVKNRDIYYQDEINNYKPYCIPEKMKSNDPLFILYTSGSTGKPKGIVHGTGGYLVYASLTHKLIFDYQKDDIYWCTADIGWITGHSYIVYGPLSNGATSLIYEGIPTYPDASRFWKICEKHSVNSFYTAPTVIRSLMKEDDKFVKTSDLSSLKVLGTVGEPINQKAWQWYHDIVGNSKTPIVDTWWQTETGGILISPIPNTVKLKAGSATLPFLGIKPEILDNSGNIIQGNSQGNLCISNSWPGQMQTIYNDHNRFINTYFNIFKGKYFTGDGCKKDKDDYYYITGRIDDIINVSGHRIGTAEIESALVSHTSVCEAAVISYNHDLKGEAIFAYVSLMSDVKNKHNLEDILKDWIKEYIGSIAKPEYIIFTKNLPKTRSGKIMRRILRKIVNNEYNNLGDTSTLSDPFVINELIENVNKKLNREKL